MSDLPASEEIPRGAAPAGARHEGGATAVLRLLRPRQWSKNLLVFAALVFARQLFVWPAVALAVLAFVSFCLASSSGYVVNDLLDAERDRAHPEKRHRPIASGAVSRTVALWLAGVLTLGALLLAFAIEVRFGWAIAIYLALTHFYSLAGKNVVILDVMLIAAGFVLRAVGGALAIDVPSSEWFIVCTLFGALFLALSKRRAEMIALESGAGRHRSVLDQYSADTLRTFTTASLTAVLLSYALYVLDTLERSEIGFHPLELTMPFVLFGVFRYHLLVERSGFGEKPEEVFLRDRPFRWSLLGFAVVALWALY